MSKDIDNLLKGLDMGATIPSASSGKLVIDIFDRERKQIEWLCANNIIRHKKRPETFIGDAASNELKESLADLAFRLRDEAETNYLPEATCLVHEYVDVGVNKMYSHNFNGARSWFCFLARPIHWIIAALIAKQLAKENTNVKDR